MPTLVDVPKTQTTALPFFTAEELDWLERYRREFHPNVGIAKMLGAFLMIDVAERIRREPEPKRPQL